MRRLRRARARARRDRLPAARGPRRRPARLRSRARHPRRARLGGAAARTAANCRRRRPRRARSRPAALAGYRALIAALLALGAPRGRRAAAGGAPGTSPTTPAFSARSAQTLRRDGGARGDRPSTRSSRARWRRAAGRARPATGCCSASSAVTRAARPIGSAIAEFVAPCPRTCSAWRAPGRCTPTPPAAAATLAGRPRRRARGTRSTRAAAARRRRPVWVTESGAGAPDPGRPRRGRSRRRTRRLPRARRPGARAGAPIPRVGAVFQYEFRDDPAFPVGPGERRSHAAEKRLRDVARGAALGAGRRARDRPERRVRGLSAPRSNTAGPVRECSQGSSRGRDGRPRPRREVPTRSTRARRGCGDLGSQVLGFGRRRPLVDWSASQRKPGVCRVWSRLTRRAGVCYGRRDMRSGVEMGRDAQTRGNACVTSGARTRIRARHRPQGLTLTHEMFSAKVGSSTAELRISVRGRDGLGGSLVFPGAASFERSN